MDLAQLFAEAASDQEMDEGPRPDPEAVISNLRELFDAYTAPNPFKPGDLVMPRNGVNLHGHGHPHIVVEVSDDMPRFFDADSPGGHTHGTRLNTRILGFMHDAYVAHWVDHYEIEPYAPAA